MQAVITDKYIQIEPHISTGFQLGSELSRHITSPDTGFEQMLQEFCLEGFWS